ncbi:MAG: helix-turn-helix domain-containing protein [Thermodesulfovibrionales bacterium]|nr:helix-turn-helix domain-containing protein [Thermodesulfovibrionales bacterium]
MKFTNIQLDDEEIERIARRLYELLEPRLLAIHKPTEDRLLTVKEVANYTGYSVQWIYNNKDKLQPHYISRKPLFRLSTINEILNNNRPINRNKTLNSINPIDKSENHNCLPINPIDNSEDYNCLPIKVRKFKKQR